MNIFNSLLAQLVKYGVHTTRKINLIHAIFYHILSLYLSVSLFVCQFMLYSSLFDNSLYQTSCYIELGTGPGKNLLNFGSPPPLKPNPGLFWRILQHCKMAAFLTVYVSLFYLLLPVLPVCDCREWMSTQQWWLLSAVCYWKNFTLLWLPSRLPACRRQCYLWRYVLTWIAIWLPLYLRDHLCSYRYIITCVDVL